MAAIKPRDFFYDTPFHLEEQHAIEHSERLLPYLKANLPPRAAYRATR